MQERKYGFVIHRSDRRKEKLEDSNSRLAFIEEELQMRITSLTAEKAKADKLEKESHQKLLELSSDIEYYKNLYEETKETALKRADR